MPAGSCVVRHRDPTSTSASGPRRRCAGARSATGRSSRCRRKWCGWHVPTDQRSPGTNGGTTTRDIRRLRAKSSVGRRSYTLHTGTEHVDLWWQALASGVEWSNEAPLRRADGQYEGGLWPADPRRRRADRSLDGHRRRHSRPAVRGGGGPAAKQAWLSEAQRLSHTESWAFNAAGFDYGSPELFAVHGLAPRRQSDTRIPGARTPRNSGVRRARNSDDGGRVSRVRIHQTNCMLPRIDPLLTDRSVLTHNSFGEFEPAILCHHRLNFVRDEPPIFWVYERQVFRDGWRLAAGGEAMDREQLGRPVVETGGIECPASRVAEPLRFRQPGLASPQGLLRLAPVVNVDADAHPANDPPVGVADRQATTKVPTVLPVRPGAAAPRCSTRRPMREPAATSPRVGPGVPGVGPAPNRTLRSQPA